jgi:hypothetical protein
MAEASHLPVHDCHAKEISHARLCKATPLFTGMKSARRYNDMHTNHQESITAGATTSSYNNYRP